jgi:hypothetical protein
MTRRNGVPAMPEQLFSPASLLWLYDLIDKVDADRTTYDSCLAVKYRVRNVPLKPDPANVEDKYKEVVAESRDGMSHFFPKKIVPLNIGSNDGLVEVLRKLWDDHKASANAHQYKYIVADTNIFWRSIRVRKNQHI